MVIQSAAATASVDAFGLARAGGVVEGSIDAHRLPRVADQLAAGAARVDWRIVGGKDALGRPALRVELGGEVPVSCQRCFADLAWPIDQSTELLLARTEAELAVLDADSASEVVLAAVPLDPLTLIEDELVLALPFAPRHPDGTCTTPAGSDITHRRA